MFPFRSPVRQLGAGSVCGLWDQYSPLEIKSAHVLVEVHSSSNNPNLAVFLPVLFCVFFLLFLDLFIWGVCVTPPPPPTPPPPFVCRAVVQNGVVFLDFSINDTSVITDWALWWLTGVRGHNNYVLIASNYKHIITIICKICNYVHVITNHLHITLTHTLRGFLAPKDIISNYVHMALNTSLLQLCVHNY